ncbi:hypothetical protein CUD01_01250 [Cellulomonas uda]|uniref:Uncharacterized protein n=1 Tax=Cellulomonas uda TaxID=1714 RepID=A0A4Y3K5A4_CELUD|nr:hypothetical protein CUD01_01250 [Cellulomonas uda]
MCPAVELRRTTVLEEGMADSVRDAVGVVAAPAAVWSAVGRRLVVADAHPDSAKARTSIVASCRTR